MAYAVLRLRGHTPDDASRLISRDRPVSQLVPNYTVCVEDWLAAKTEPEA